MTPSKATPWCRNYTVCSNTQCTNWIWSDKLRPDTGRRKCGHWWPAVRTGIGKGKGQGRPHNKQTGTWTSRWIDTPPGLVRLKPLRKTKIQKEASDLLEAFWTGMPVDVQEKLQNLGIGPTKAPEPDLTEMLKTHMAALPPQVQEAVTRLTAPVTEKDIATKLKGQVSDLKNLSIKKTQLQEKLDHTKAQYQTLLLEMQELQQKLHDGQKTSKQTSQGVNKDPQPEELDPAMEVDPLPAALETF